MRLALPWPFEREFMQLALVAGVVVGATAPLIGGFLVQKRLSLMGDGIGHAAFAGVAAGLLFGVWPVWTALVAATLGAVGVEWLRARGTTPGDLALALLFYGGIAAGVVLASRSTAGTATLGQYLFGAILTVDPSDVRVIVTLGLVIVAAVTITGRALFAIVLDEESARVAGLPVRGLNTLLAVLTAVTIVAGMRVVGVLLVSAMMVMPVATSRLWSASFRSTLVGGSAVGTGAVVAGLAMARVFDLAPGGTIVLVAAGLFAVSTLARGLHTRIGSILPDAG